MLLHSSQYVPIVGYAVEGGIEGGGPAWERVAGYACEPDPRGSCDCPGTGFPAPGSPSLLPALVQGQWMCDVVDPTVGFNARYGGASAAAFHRTSL